MKKHIGIDIKRIAALFIFIALLVVERTTFAEEIRGRITAPHIMGVVGEIVDLPIAMESNPGIVSLYLSIKYDSDLVELVGVENGIAMPDSVCTVTYGPTFEQNPYIAIWLSTASENITNTGTLLNLSFRIKPDAAGKEAVIEPVYSEASTYDVDFNYVKFDVVKGSIMVQPVEDEIIKGDVTGDEKVNTGDAVALLKYAAGIMELTDLQKKAADANPDEKINTADAVVILRYCAGIIGGL